MIIGTNKNKYLELFEKKTDISKLLDSIKDFTKIIDKELKRQRLTLIFINIINWAIPIGLLAYICTYIHYLIKEINF